MRKNTKSQIEDIEKKEKLYRRESIEALVVAILGYFWLSIIFEPLALIFGIKIRKGSADSTTRRIAMADIIISLIAFGLMILSIMGFITHQYFA